MPATPSPVSHFPQSRKHPTPPFSCVLLPTRLNCPAPDLLATPCLPAPAHCPILTRPYHIEHTSSSGLLAGTRFFSFLQLAHLSLTHTPQLTLTAHPTHLTYTTPPHTIYHHLYHHYPWPPDEAGAAMPLCPMCAKYMVLRRSYCIVWLRRTVTGPPAQPDASCLYLSREPPTSSTEPHTKLPHQSPSSSSSLNDLVLCPTSKQTIFLSLPRVGKQNILWQLCHTSIALPTLSKHHHHNNNLHISAFASTNIQH